MSDPKDGTSFFRKVVKFVANPATDWTQLAAPSDEARESEYAKSELKAMIERKRRNDFVRKRELDMLRKVRREGLTSEQLAALGGSSRLDDSEARLPESGAKPDSGVKAKIDEIEQQMVGDGLATPSRRTPAFYDAPTQPGGIGYAKTEPDVSLSRPAPRSAPAASQPATAVMGPGMSPLSPNEVGGAVEMPLYSQETSEVAHDPDLDEAVIAFANADFETCEQSLAALTGKNGPRADHAETWLALFDLYRAIGQQPKFESLALEYAQQFGWSAPQWFSMPRLVADAAEVRTPKAGADSQVGWVSPELIDADVVAKLRSQTLQMPLPWVFDWSALQSIDAEGSAKLSELFRGWIGETMDMRWNAGEKLLQVLQEAAPTGVRDADPVFWQLRLDVLRMANRPDQFDETAIDYCVTYEVSPPSWEPAHCKVRVGSADNSSTQSPSMAAVSDVSTSFLESQISDEPGVVQVAGVELSGQLVGDISATLGKMNAELGTATIVNVSCARLIRVDFIAAGDLLNWVLARRSENRAVSFSDSHRLVALFFGAMGINEHAKVKVRIV